MDKVEIKDFDKILNSIKKETEKDILRNAYHKDNGFYVLNEQMKADDKARDEICALLDKHNFSDKEKGNDREYPIEEDTRETDIEKLSNILKTNAKLIVELQDKVRSYEDIIKQRQAEFENYKKRTLKERNDFKVIANQKILEELLPIADSLDKAINLPKERLDIKSLLDGIMLIEKQFAKILLNNGVKPIKALNKEFDPSIHEAIQVESPASGTVYKTDTVVKEWQKGYFIKDKIFRPSKVVIVKSNCEDTGNDNIPTTIQEKDFYALFDKIAKQDLDIIKSSYEKGEGQYIIKDSIISDDKKIKAIKEVFASLN